ncbi:NIPSNAP family containing protein [Hymenobacter taeanensis]|uniref:NIPSNAP family containing protein n=1 Tax=Hymenobacter taeanensis TaxID=2735321 RepID=A0A6M6BLL7_9BACT|nr:MULTISPECIES: NIPSNAP family protein [Hymenobacter]QJX48820.1 NIPSNAP family containing protein [Hymenobacter taeanensis]UOQ81669.1 NIPSNAP family protein [Hymenobacter sp. 5414T-23]
MKQLQLVIITILFACGLGSGHAAATTPAGRPAYLELKVYHLKTSQQEAVIDSFLQLQYMPALHAAGIATIGVFKPIGNDTAADRRIYVLTPYSSLKQWEKVTKETTNKLLAAGGTYVNAAHNNPAYSRLETVFIKPFEEMTDLIAPRFSAPKNERVYELRSYEGASEKIFRNKVQMFNAGGEIKLFSRLDFNAIFYGEVVFGSKMPNLMYMTSFPNMPAREAHWKAFGSDPEWKKLSSLPEYQNNVSHIDIVFLRPTEYSEL